MIRSSGRGLSRALLLGLVLLLLAGCSEKPAAPSQEVPSSAAISPPVASPMEHLLEGTGISLDVATPLDAANLERSKASAHQRFESVDPALELLILSYEDAKAAALALPIVASWVNRSGLMHRAEAMAEGTHVLLVGLKAGSEPNEDTKAVVNKLLNVFVSGAAKL